MHITLPPYMLCNAFYNALQYIWIDGIQSDTVWVHKFTQDMWFNNNGLNFLVQFLHTNSTDVRKL